MKEIGGYFELENFNGASYHSCGIALNCARNALLFATKFLSMKKLRLPYFLCGSVQNACKNANLPISFYRISKDFLPDLQFPLETENAKDRLTHILGRKEECASLYYEDFKKNDKSFSTSPIRKMSVFSQMTMNAIDYISVEKKRNQNYAVLQEILGATNEMQFNMPFAPFCYPYYTKNASIIRKKLATQEIYVPTL